MGRTTFRQLIGIVILTASALLAAQGPQREPVTSWKNGRWFDGESFRSVDVFSIGSRLALKPPSSVDRSVDLGGAYVTPAFGEAHNHNIQGSDAGRWVQTYLSQGIFYVMIQANMPQTRDQLRGRINEASTVDVAYSNGVFTAPGGHPSALVERQVASGFMAPVDRDGGFLLPVATTADVDRQWRTRVAQQRPDFIKMILVYSEDRSAGVPRPSTDRHGLDPALAPSIVRLAHNDKLRVSAHVESAYDFDVAVRAGADVIAHLPGFWPDPERIARDGLGIYAIREETARLAGERGVTMVTTITRSLQTRMNDQTTPGFGRPLLELYRQNLAILAKHRVRIAIGSDENRATSIQEAFAIQGAGLMPAAALLRALSTDAAATIFSARAPFGVVEGAPADFLVLDGNPLEDFSAITRIRLAVKSGRELPRSAPARAN